MSGRNLISNAENSNKPETPYVFPKRRFNSGISRCSVNAERNPILKRDVDYLVVCSNNTDVGTADVAINGIGIFSGAISTTFEIRPIDVAQSTIDDILTQWSTDEGAEPLVIVSGPLKNAVLQKGKDYTCSYADNVKTGTATVTITGIGNYTGTKSVPFKVFQASFVQVQKTLALSVAKQSTTIMIFFIMKAVPGSPFTEEKTNVVAEEANRVKYGLDKPVYVQYGMYLEKIVKFDFGETLKMQKGTRALGFLLEGEGQAEGELGDFPARLTRSTGAQGKAVQTPLLR